jgi:hypothetical protein
MEIDFQFPDLRSPLFIVKKVAVDDDGSIIGAAVIRIEAEQYLWVDKQRSSRVRWQAVEELARSSYRSAWAAGLENLVAWIPCAVEKTFAHALEKLGWIPDRDGWRSWSRPLKGGE